MNYLEMILIALEGIWANKLRSGLTMLGIIIGVLSMIIVITLGQGASRRVLTEMQQIGTNLFVIYLGQVEDGQYDQYKIRPNELRFIRSAVNGLRGIVPVSYNTTSVQSRRKTVSATAIGTESGFEQIRNIGIQRGHFFNRVDDAVGRRVVVINKKLADDLFLNGADPIGQKIVVGRVPVYVCGVAKPESSFFSGGRQTPVLYMPIKPFMEAFQVDGFFELEGSAASKDQVATVSKQVVRILETRHRAQGKKVYQGFNMEQQMQAANQVTGILTWIIGAIAGVSLMVGGIGIMNIMLVSVTERTREIGIRIAVGAQRRDVLIQFLIEAIVLSVLGGLIGTLLGLGFAFLICIALKVPFGISIGTLLLALLFSIAVGVFFGMYPANRAAKLDPIESLRYE
ncbi:MAG: ABC transporter permease [Solirubrobacterales bacterium]